jgi:hypothetical protein
MGWVVEMEMVLETATGEDGAVAEMEEMEEMVVLAGLVNLQLSKEILTFVSLARSFYFLLVTNNACLAK